MDPNFELHFYAKEFRLLVADPQVTRLRIDFPAGTGFDALNFESAIEGNAYAFGTDHTTPLFQCRITACPRPCGGGS